MPFVPRSIITKFDNPVCAAEITGYSTSKYTTNIHLFDEPENLNIFAYPINKETLEYASDNISMLSINEPLIRFALTGENFILKYHNGRELNSELVYPDVNQSIKSVFDGSHPSHLVLLVNQKITIKSRTNPLPWISENEELESES